MIYITGDTHGEFRRIIDFCDRVETTRDDVMIILGDAGINFSGYPRDGWKKQLLARLPLKIFCIHGNHEKRPETKKAIRLQPFMVVPPGMNMIILIFFLLRMGKSMILTERKVLLLVVHTVSTNGIGFRWDIHGLVMSSHPMK